MYTNFAAQFAPEVALPPYGEFDTPEPEAGLAPPEHLYDSRGNPLNYIQTEGGPREFLVPRGQAAFAAPPGPNSPQAPVRLRGRTQQTPDYPLGANTDPQPQDLMRPQQPGTRFGQRATLPIPPAPVRNGPRAVIPIPPSPSQIAASGAIQQRQTEDQVIGAAFDQRAMRNARNPVGSIQDEFNAGTAGGLGTLQRLIQESGFGEQLSNFISQLQGRAPDGPGRRRAPGAEMESELRGMSNPHNELSMVDTPPGNVVPTASRVGRAELPDFSTNEGLADFNRRMGLQLGRQVRTQAEQDSLYNRGLTPTRNSAHIGGRALDWPARQLPDGRRGREAEQYVRGRIAAAYGEDVANSYDYQWESGRGRYQGTGPHVHVEPR